MESSDDSENSQEVPKVTYFIEGEYIDVYAARERDVLDMKNMISGAEVMRRDVSAVINIIHEEAAYYFAGHKSIDDVIRVIKNRIQLLGNAGRAISGIIAQSWNMEKAK